MVRVRRTVPPPHGCEHVFDHFDHVETLQSIGVQGPASQNFVSFDLGHTAPIFRGFPT
jgi:hypothetical protein